MRKLIATALTALTLAAAGAFVIPAVGAQTLSGCQARVATLDAAIAKDTKVIAKLTAEPDNSYVSARLAYYTTYRAKYQDMVAALGDCSQFAPPPAPTPVPWAFDHDAARKAIIAANGGPNIDPGNAEAKLGPTLFCEAIALHIFGDPGTYAGIDYSKGDACGGVNGVSGVQDNTGTHWQVWLQSKLVSDVPGTVDGPFGYADATAYGVAFGLAPSLDRPAH